MPKGKRRAKNEGRRGEAANNSASEDESNDNASEWSTQSETRSVLDDAGDEATEEAVIDRFEDTLIKAIDEMGQKSGAGRVKCMSAAAGCLRARLLPGLLALHRVTLTDHVERALKKGRADEQAAAAELAELIAIQLSGTDLCEELYKDLKPVLLVLTLDKSVNSNTRAKCVTALGIISFLADDDMGSIYELMRSFETVFSSSYLKGDGSINSKLAAEDELLHSCALSVWGLLLSLCSPGDICMMLGGSTSTFAPSLRQLSGMLASPGLEVRLGAGECLALAFELGRDHSDNFAEDLLPDLIEDMKQLATDSHKYRAKKDRKTQRATFRDILRYLEEDDMEDIVLKVHGETVRIEGWCARRRYTVLGTALGAGLQQQLATSLPLRSLLGLPPPVRAPEPVAASLRSNNKLMRHLQNAAAFKARTISRGKNRDKRSALTAS